MTTITMKLTFVFVLKWKPTSVTVMDIKRFEKRRDVYNVDFVGFRNIRTKFRFLALRTIHPITRTVVQRLFLLVPFCFSMIVVIVNKFT